MCNVIKNKNKKYFQTNPCNRIYLEIIYIFYSKHYYEIRFEKHKRIQNSKVCFWTIGKKIYFKRLLYV